MVLSTRKLPYASMTEAEMVRGAPATTARSEVCEMSAIWSASDGITRKETCEKREEGVSERSLCLPLSLSRSLSRFCSFLLSLSRSLEGLLVKEVDFKNQG